MKSTHNCFIVILPTNKQTEKTAVKSKQHLRQKWRSNQTPVPSFSPSFYHRTCLARPLGLVASVVSQQNAISGQRRAFCRHCSGNETRSLRIRPRRRAARDVYPSATVIRIRRTGTLRSEEMREV